MPAAPSSKADAFVVSCIDPRLTNDVTNFLGALGREGRYSEMRIAGAALALAEPDRHPAWATTVWENLDASRRLHGVRRVVLINHRDCGALDLWAGRRLADDPAGELRIHHDVLERAAAAVRLRHPDMAIEIKVMELDGKVRILPCAACRPAGPLRAEAVGDPAGAIIDAASANGGAVIAAPAQAAPARDRAGFAELVRLRFSGTAPDAEAELALLTEGVTRFGLTAHDARAVLETEAQRRGLAGAGAAAREVRALLRSQADARGRVARADVERAVQLYRRRAGRPMGDAAATRQIVALMAEEALAPRPEGLLRSTTWHRRMLEA